MELIEPGWLLLVIPAIVIGWWWRMPSPWLRALRAILIATIIAAMARPAILVSASAGTVIVVADRSRSMPDRSEKTQLEIIEAVHGSMPPRGSLGVISFGEKVSIEQMPGREAFNGFITNAGPDGSSLAEAIRRGTEMLQAHRPGRLLIVTDGRWTGEAPQAAAAAAAASGAALDIIELSRGAANDVAVERIDAPSSVDPGAGFLIDAWIISPTRQEIRYVLQRGDQALVSGTVEAETGRNRLLFRDRLPAAGTARYQLEVLTHEGTPDVDPAPENNRAAFLVTSRHARRVLHIAQLTRSGLARALTSSGVELDSALPDQVDWTLPTLSSYAAVILENVPASSIGQHGLETLASWLRSGAGGLLITGGRSSFATGGYFRSPLDPLLPVSMELRQEHRKLALAAVIALDRSGSMAAPAGAGRTKMDLASLAAAEVVSMLTPMDELGVLAVDSTAHVVADLDPVNEPELLRSRILSIESMGGGIFVYEALATAAGMLSESEAGTRHMLLLADAADAEEPGRYRDLLEHCAAAGITVSVVGLGTSGDPDAGLLTDIARRGRGQVYFTTDPTELPRLFAQDTFVVSRSTFIENETPLGATPALASVLGRVLPDPPVASGYNLCYARPGAQIGVLSRDEIVAPVVATWHADSSRVACVTTELERELAGGLVDWPFTGELLSGLVRWTMGADLALPRTMMATQEIDHGVLKLRLHIDPGAVEAMLTSGEATVSIAHALETGGARQSSHSLRWLDADLLGLDIQLSDHQPLMATVHIGEAGRATLPPQCLPYPAELAPGSFVGTQAELRALARTGGGTLRHRPETVWDDMPRGPRRLELSSWLYLLSLIVLLSEVAQRRAGLVAGLLSSVTGSAGHPDPTEQPEDTAQSDVETGSSRPSPGSMAGGQAPEEASTPTKEAGSSPGLLEALDAIRRRRDPPGR